MGDEAFCEQVFGGVICYCVSSMPETIAILGLLTPDPWATYKLWVVPSMTVMITNMEMLWDHFKSTLLGCSGQLTALRNPLVLALVN